jgi:hypothetical protein
VAEGGTVLTCCGWQTHREFESHFLRHATLLTDSGKAQKPLSPVVPPDLGELKRAGYTRPTRGLLLAQLFGAIAQLAEHLFCTQDVVGSIPTSSTNIDVPVAE